MAKTATERVKVSLFVAKSLHRRLKHLSVDTGISIQSLITQSIQEFKDPSSSNPEIEMMVGKIRELLLRLKEAEAPNYHTLCTVFDGIVEKFNQK